MLNVWIRWMWSRNAWLRTASAYLYTGDFPTVVRTFQLSVVSTLNVRAVNFVRLDVGF